MQAKASCECLLGDPPAVTDCPLDLAIESGRTNVGLLDSKQEYRLTLVVLAPVDVASDDLLRVLKRRESQDSRRSADRVSARKGRAKRKSKRRR